MCLKSGCNRQRLAITVASSYTTTASHFYSLPPARWFSLLRRHLILTPLHKFRHNNPFIVIIPAPAIKIHLGSLPSRLNFIIIFLYLLSNVLYCTLYLPWGGSVGPGGKFREPTEAALIAEFRGRTGVMAVVNMVPLFVCMARNNFVGQVVGIGFDSVVHMLAWAVNKVDQAGWKGLNEAVKTSHFYQVGLMAEIALILIAVLSASPLRHANYEFFLSVHQLLVVFFVAGVWWHLYIDILPQMVYCNFAIAIWVADRVFRILRILRNNIRWRRRGLSCSVAEVSPLEGGDAVRFSVELSTPFKYRPGTHAYLYVPRIGWWQSHPFSIAWSSIEESTQMVEMTQTPERWEIQNSTPTTATPQAATVHFIISKRNGFTKALYDAAQSAAATADPEKPETRCALKVLGLVEGPYDGHHSFDSFGTVVLVAGGVGITHCLGYVRHLLHRYSEGTVATQRVKLVRVIRKSEHINWVSDWLEEILRMPLCRRVHTTISGNGWAGRGGLVKVHVRRPEFETVLEKVVRRRVGATAVTVCGGGAVSDSVRTATLKFVDQATIDFSEESFTWYRQVAIHSFLPT
ncbi:hypothetical protein C7212DRAFT_349471 [Tuber magnatum]|uniref:ferric-chelate reductase (NADPH) n=1 Tax=Tuber magnatum TaxID=42249 RepID=A0A317SZN0_9PEZI|nr:hypothetical protein C7212DRAFT_349471 [Tuber magnatum]